MSHFASEITCVNTNPQEKERIPTMTQPSVAARSRPQLVKMLSTKKKLAWLDAMYQRGFHLIKLWGCNPRLDLQVDAEKAGHVHKRLRCYCTGGRNKSCGSEGKHPVVGRQGKDSFRRNYSADVAAKQPRMNWGLCTGADAGKVVIDIDADKGGFESFQKLLGEHGLLPETMTIKTGGGGRHIIFNHPGEEWYVKSLSSHPELGAGIDVKGDGGYVVAAGSLHHSGNYYLPENEIDGPDSIILADLPEWLLKKIAVLKSELPTKPSPLTPEQIASLAAHVQRLRETPQANGVVRWATVALDRECEKVLLASSCGNQTQNKAAFAVGQIVGAGLLDYNQALSALLDSANARKGKSRGEVARKTIVSGLSAGMLQPRFPSNKTLSNSISESEADAEWIDFNDPGEIDIVEQIEYTIKHYQAARDLQEKAQVDIDITDLRQANEFIVVSTTSHRCDKCNPNLHSRPCVACAMKTGVTRPHPGNKMCVCGGRLALRSKLDRRKGGGIVLNCRKWGCAICGFDLEFDYLIHHDHVSSRLLDDSPNPQIGYPSKHVEDTHINYVDVQSGCWTIEIKGNKERRRYANKLSKLSSANIGTDYIIDYSGSDVFQFFITLSIGFDPARLKYKSRTTGEVVQPHRITFAERDTLHRQYLAEFGHIISLRKSEWEMIEEFDLEGRRVRSGYNASAHSARILPPQRKISSGKNESVGHFTSEDDLKRECEAFNVACWEKNPRSIDKSSHRGMTLEVRRMFKFDFPDSMTNEDIDAFFDRVTGKNRIIEPYGPYDDWHSTRDRLRDDRKGIACHSNASVT